LRLIGLGLTLTLRADRIFTVPNRIGARQIALNPARAHYCRARESEGGQNQAQVQATAHLNISLQRATCSRTRSGAVPP